MTAVIDSSIARLAITTLSARAARSSGVSVPRASAASTAWSRRLRRGIELYYDRPYEAWFDARGRWIVKAEPFDPRSTVVRSARAGPAPGMNGIMRAQTGAARWL